MGLKLLVTGTNYRTRRST